MKIESFKEKLVFITGGSSGIGLETARLLVREGAHVVIFGRTQAKLDATGLTAYSLDVTDNQMVQRVVELAVNEQGVPDILINCAGRAVPHYFEDITYEMFDATMRTNLYGQWSMCAALVPKMQNGYIVNVSSMAGFIGVFGYSDYAASKYASVGFSEVLRSELRGRGIGVSVLCPPDTDTPGFAEENITKPAETIAASEGGGVMQPAAVALALLDGMRKGRFIIIPGREGKLVYLLKRLFPGLLERIIQRSISRVQ